MDLGAIFNFLLPGGGINWDLVAGWAISFLVFKKFFFGLGDRVSGLLLKLLNKIPVFKSTDLDEKLFTVVGQHLSTKVRAKMQTAQEIKEDYHIRIAEAMKAKNDEQVRQLSKMMRDELEGLTRGVVEEFFSDSESLLWELVIDRYGNHAKAAKWVYQKVKALVEEFKDPSHPSTAILLAKHVGGALGELGNEL